MLATKSPDYTSVFFSQKAFKDLITQVHVALKLSGIHTHTEKGWPPALITMYRLPERELWASVLQKGNPKGNGNPLPWGGTW